MLSPKLLAATGTTAPGSVWQPLFYRDDVTDTAFSSTLNLYVAVTSQGTIFTSPDGTTWTPTSVATNALNAVVWSGSRFVAVGASRILTSTNGTTWTTADTTAQTWYGVAWSGSVFVAVGTGGNIRRSTSGITWSAASTAVSNTLYTVVWGSRFIVGGANGRILSSSATGVTWTIESAGTSVPTWRASAYSGTRYLLAGPNDEAYTSTNGTTWTNAGPLGFDNRGAAWGNSVFVVVALTGEVYTGTNAAIPTWTYITVFQNALNTVTFDGTFFVISGSGMFMARSTDGVSWTVLNSGTTLTLSGIASDGLGRLIAVGNRGWSVNSIDGVTWTKVATTETSLTSIAYSPTASRYVAVGLFGDATYSSTGATWTSVNISGFFTDWYSVIWAGTKFLVGGVTSTLYQSADGISWSTFYTFSGSRTVWDIAFDGALTYVVVGESGFVATSTNGGTVWTIYSVGITNYSVVWTGAQFVIGSSGGNIYTSPTGATWTLQTSGVAPAPLYAVDASSTSNIIALGGTTTSVAVYSSNGTTWINAVGSALQPYANVVFAPEFDDRYFAVGTNGQISVSPPTGATRVI